MSNKPLSFFTRLYLNIIFTVIFSVCLAFIVIETYTQRQDFKQFARTAELVVSYVDIDYERLDYLDEKQTKLKLPYPLNMEFSALLLAPSDNRNQCRHCDHMIDINGHPYFEMEHGERFVSLPVENRDLSLVFYEKLFAEIIVHEQELELDESEQEVFDHEPPEEGIYILSFLISTLIIFLGLTIYRPIKRLHKEVKRLIRSQRAFGGGDLTARADEDIQRPLNELAHSFNEMADAIANNVKERDIFAQAIPHEVRTPLSRIQLASGLIRKKNSDFDTLSLLDDVDNYVTDINHLISQIVEFSRLNEHNRAEQDDVQAINLSDFIHARVKLLSRLTEKNIDCELAPNLTLTTNSVYLRLLVDNFVKNAINYSMSQITIRVEQKQDTLVFCVEDDGVGIPEDQVDTIFFPFARLDQSRNRATGGLGLGLPIAKAAAEKMHGNIKVSRASLGGAKFEFTAPAEG